MSRSAWKGLYISKNVLKKKKKVFKIWTRNSSIPSSLIGKTALIHNGQSFVKVLITRDKVGYKFGEFSLTRRYFKKKLDLKLNRKKKN